MSTYREDGTETGKYLCDFVSQYLHDQYMTNMLAIRDYIYIQNASNDCLLMLKTNSGILRLADRLSESPWSLFDADDNVLDTWQPEPYTDKTKPFIEEFYGLAEELDQVTLTSDALLKASEYFGLYYQDKDSYENCLKTAQGQLAIYLSE